MNLLLKITATSKNTNRQIVKLNAIGAWMSSLTIILTKPKEKLSPNLQYPTMKTHELKVHESYVNLLLSGRKTFEVRKNDRDFQEGDVLILRPWDEKKEEYIGGNTEFYYNVTYVLHGGKFGIEEGYCVMGIVPNPAINRSFLHQYFFKVYMKETANYIDTEIQKLELLLRS